MKRYFTIVAVGLLAGLLLFVFVNLVLYIAMSIFFASKAPRLSDKMKAYPGWSAEDVRALVKLMTEEGLPMRYDPYVQYREIPMHNRFVNIDPAGFRVSKNQAPWPPRRDAVNVFVFGGSTTFGYGLPDDETIPSYMSECSKRPLAIYNFGRGGYMSTQEMILFQQLLSAGYAPQIAIFIDGPNDFVLADGKPAFTDKLQRFMAGEMVELDKVPMVWVAEWLMHRGAKTDYSAPAALQTVADRWLANKDMIEVLGSHFGVRTLFVWQPVAMYGYDRRYDVFAQSDNALGNMLRTKYGYPLMQDLRAQGKLGTNVLWLADIQQDKHENLYTDNVHYTAAFSKEIADKICGAL